MDYSGCIWGILVPYGLFRLQLGHFGALGVQRWTILVSFTIFYYILVCLTIFRAQTGPNRLHLGRFGPKQGLNPAETMQTCMFMVPSGPFRAQTGPNRLHLGRFGPKPGLIPAETMPTCMFMVPSGPFRGPNRTTPAPSGPLRVLTRRRPPRSTVFPHA